MNLALKAEADNGVTTLECGKDAPLTHEEICGYLNIGLVREFNQTQLQHDVLREFVFAMDEFSELVKTENYPNGRLLNSSDIAAAGFPVVCAFNDLARRRHDQSMWGCAVGAATSKAVEGFFETTIFDEDGITIIPINYLKTIATLLKALGSHSIMFTLDGQSLQVGINRFSADPEFGILSYSNFNEETSAMIPFHLTRILGV